jgi:uncharacterized protein (DUF1330 family)
VLKIAILSLAVAAVGLVAAALWQHLRYLEIRRERVDDRQPLLHRGSAFHGVVLLKVADGAGREGELAALRAVRDAIEAGGGMLVYAGVVVQTMVPSTQLENDWSAAILAQYPSRDAFDRSHKSPELKHALQQCEHSHIHGFERSALTNLLIPLGLGGVRLLDIARRRDNILPFEPVSEEDALPQLRERGREMLGRFDAYRDVREDAVVIFNLLQPGTPDQRAADRAYGYQMMRGMAEGAYGPMHMGRAVTVEGDSRFSSFAAVYYPGIDHMQAMLSSTFMNRIASGKQLGDTLAFATIPVLSKL